MQRTVQDAYEDGWECFILNYDFYDNPYDVHTDHWYSWNDGWKDAKTRKNKLLDS